MHLLLCILILIIILPLSKGGYYYSNGVPSFTWLQAKQDCEARGMQLAKLDSQSDLDDAVAYMNSETGNNIANDIWVGMKYDMTSTPYVYRWISCDIPTFTTWYPGEPNNQQTDPCIRLQRIGFTLRTIGCNQQYDYLCSDASPPYVYRNFSELSSPYHASVTFECPYCSILPILNVEWEFNNGTIVKVIDSSTNVNKYTGSTTSSTSLVIADVGVSDMGSYSCHVTNSRGVGMGSSIGFTISDFPIVISPQFLYITKYGDSVVLNCSFRGQPEVTSIQWKMIHSRGIFLYNDAASTHYSSGTVMTPDLYIHSVNFQDVGNFTCEATNQVGTTVGDIITVDVIGVQAEISSPTYTVVYGEQVTLDCTIWSKPDLKNVSWEREINGTAVCVDLGNTSKYLGSNKTWHSLLILDADFSDAGKYYCQGETTDLSGRSSETLLDVIGGLPNIMINQTEVRVNASERITLFCEASGLPNVISVEWKKKQNGVFISFTGNIQGGDINSPPLTFSSTTLGDIGEYICTATNLLGNTSSSPVLLDVIKNEPMCPCSCEFKRKLDYWASQNTTNYTMAELRVILAPVLEEIKRNLTVDKSTLTKTKLKYISAKDNRSSASQVGAVGIAFMTVVIGGLILIDILSIRRHVETIKSASKPFKF
ncbi:neuroglian-like [Mytilus edulis]|uniref:neuroglian-like n=1 Tax=Mytilus edulis TaxID=6550 RepID=UPI0039F0366D